MTNSEQALRDFAEKQFPLSKELKKEVLYNQMQQAKQNECLSDLTALISEHYYPKEFVEWTMMQGIMGIYDRKGYLYSSALLNLKGFKGDNTIKNLFNYWKENER